MPRLGMTAWDLRCCDGMGRDGMGWEYGRRVDAASCSTLAEGRGVLVLAVRLTRHRPQTLAVRDYDAFMHDEAVFASVIKDLHKSGLVFIKGVPQDEHSVISLASKLGTIQNSLYGMTWDVRSVPNAENVAYTSQHLGFHMDLLYMHQPPHLQFLHCIRSSAAGGASLFADSYKAAADLFSMDIDAFLELATMPASFHYNHPSNHLYHQSHLTIKISHIDGFSSFADFANSYRATSERWHLRQGRRQQSRAMNAAAALQKREMRIEDYIENVAWSPPFQAPFRNPNFRPINPNVSRLSALNQKVSLWHAAGYACNGSGASARG